MWLQINFIQLLKYVSKICHAENKRLFSRLDTISFLPSSLRIYFNSCSAKLHIAQSVHLSLLLCILNVA